MIPTWKGYLFSCYLSWSKKTIHMMVSSLYASWQHLRVCILQVCSCSWDPARSKSFWSVCSAHSDTAPRSCMLQLSLGIWGYVGCMIFVCDSPANKPFQMHWEWEEEQPSIDIFIFIYSIFILHWGGETWFLLTWWHWLRLGRTWHLF